MLREIDGDLWVAEAPQRFLGLEIGARMTLVRLPRGALWVHSPVPLTPELRDAVAALGTPRYVIAPNLFHHLHVGDWASAFDAELWTCPGLETKRPELVATKTLVHAPGPWAPDIEHVPFSGNPVHRENCFWHAASRTLIVADLVGNLRELRGLPMRVAGWLNGWGRFGPARMLRRFIRDRAAARASLDEILAWDIRRVIMGHGEILEDGGREALRSSFDWL